jgi:hypothetical protein
MVKDLMIDDSGNLLFENGDFQIKSSDEQHAVLIINTRAGSWKQSPTLGVGISEYLGASSQENELKRNILIQMQSDGFINVEVGFIKENGGIVNYTLTADRL